MFDVVLPLLLELDLSRTLLTGDRLDTPKAEKDWLRLWAIGVGEACGDVSMEDFGLAFDIMGLVDGD